MEDKSNYNRGNVTNKLLKAISFFLLEFPVMKNRKTRRTTVNLRAEVV